MSEPMKDAEVQSNAELIANVRGIRAWGAAHGSGRFVRRLGTSVVSDVRIERTGVHPVRRVLHRIQGK